MADEEIELPVVGASYHCEGGCSVKARTLLSSIKD